MSSSAVLKDVPNTSKKPDKLRVSLEERRSDELIFGFVGPVFSGVTKTAETMGELLKKQYRYEINHIKISSFIDESNSRETENRGNRIDRLQTNGDSLRQKFGNAYLAEKAVETIALGRTEDGYEAEGEGPVKNRRIGHFIDSLKHPDEVSLLRDVYGDLFWLVGVFAPESKRKERASRSIPKEDVDNLFVRDEDEGLEFGQHVRKTMHLADVFVLNDGNNTENLQVTLQRFLHTLFNTQITTPLRDEIAMFSAASAACGSACLSRQVGAAIYSKKNELLGVGRNDPPKFGGGLYTDEDVNNDNRCFKWNEKCCHNDERKKHLYENISRKHGEEIGTKFFQLIATSNIFERMGEALKSIQKELNSFKTEIMKISEEVLKTSEIRDLIEFSRAVHAEMEAIISVARKGKQGLVGATLYCTTFPCHNCARHIIAAGIEKVVFIEPYPKSLAAELHQDVISVDGSEKKETVQFVQYQGVAPKNMMKLYQSQNKRKSAGKAIQQVMHEASPVFRPPLDGFSTYEQIVVKKIQSLEEKDVNGK